MDQTKWKTQFRQFRERDECPFFPSPQFITEIASAQQHTGSSSLSEMKNDGPVMRQIRVARNSFFFFWRDRRQSLVHDKALERSGWGKFKISGEDSFSL